MTTIAVKILVDGPAGFDLKSVHQWDIIPRVGDRIVAATALSDYPVIVLGVEWGHAMTTGGIGVIEMQIATLYCRLDKPADYEEL